MTPQERKTQDRWLHDSLFTKLAGHCPRGYVWRRLPENTAYASDGYQCEGGGHIVTDEQIAEGFSGMWITPLASKQAQDQFGSGFRSLQKAQQGLSLGDADYRHGAYYPHSKGIRGEKLWCYARDLWNPLPKLGIQCTISKFERAPSFGRRTDSRMRPTLLVPEVLLYNRLSLTAWIELL